MFFLSPMDHHPSAYDVEMNNSDSDNYTEPQVAEILSAGIRLQGLGEMAEAEQSFRQVLEWEPENIDAWFRLGVVCLRQSKMFDAISNLQHALRLKPQHAEAYNNLGVLLAQNTRVSPAIACFQLALRFKPDFVDAHRNLNQAMSDLQRLGGDTLPTAGPFQVEMAEAELHYSLGLGFMLEGHYENAEAALKRAIEINPAHTMACYRLTNLLSELGDLENALTYIERCLELAPEVPSIQLERAMLLLQLGRFERGWSEFEYRWQVTGTTPEFFPRPLWDGSQSSGKTILLHAEQGIGDVFQFIRYASLVKERTGGRVLVACPPTLHRILSGCLDVDELVPMGTEFPPFDFCAPMMSLPRLFNTTLQTVPNQVPYVFPEPERVEFWRRDLQGISGLKVGIVWQGSPAYRLDHHRSIPLQNLAPLAQVPGIRLINLQKGPGADQLRTVTDGWPIIDLDRRMDEQTGAFVDTAAVMKNLDLVISADTSTAHLAGALGVPVWLAQWYVPEWRWMIGKETSPWYPTMRLFAQSRRGDWSDLFIRIADELKQMISSGSFSKF
jgi:Tfp pilus assembly protein PilF